MKVILLRHAQTAGNAESRYIGRTDQQLSQVGEQAACAARFISKPDTLYVSPMKRARRTAEILFPGSEQIICEDFREMDFGVFEGRSADEMRDDAEYAEWISGMCEAVCPGGESVQQFSDRVCAEFERRAFESISSGIRRMAVVAHGGTIMAVMKRFGHPNKTFYEWSVPNCCGYAANLDENTWPVRPELTDILRIGKTPI